MQTNRNDTKRNRPAPTRGSSVPFTPKKISVLIGGGIVTLLGIVTIVTPGPAFILIPAGLAILATEFSWAQKPLDWMRSRFNQARERYGRKKHRPGGEGGGPASRSGFVEMGARTKAPLLRDEEQGA